MIEFEVPVRLVSLLNAREHHMARARRAKTQRTAAHTLAREHVSGLVDTPLSLTVTITRIAPGKLDDDNLTGSAKHVRDGIADALGIDDGDPRITWVVEQAKFTGPHRGGYSCAVRIEVRE